MDTGSFIGMLVGYSAAVYLVQGAALGLSAAASPGPLQAYLIAQSLKLGWKRALPLALAPLLSDGPIIALVLLALTSLPPAFVRVIQLAGGLFVLYLAWKSLQAYRQFRGVEFEAGAGHKTFLQAVMINLLNPGPYLFWSLIAGPVLVRGWNQSPAWGTAFVGAFYVVMIFATAMIVVLFGAARQLGPRVNRALLGFSALALAGFGLYQLWQGLSSI